MRLVFWVSFALVGYTYVGYCVLLWLHVRLWPKPVFQIPIRRRVSIIIAARNEEANLPAKLENLRELNYPSELLQIVIASDGSTDRTAEILQWHGSMIVPVILKHSNGKAYALNEAVQHATGEILVFLDARQPIDPDAITELVSCFGDCSVGAVSGELLLQPNATSSSSDALGVYWKIEKTIRKLESLSGSVVGVTGAIYAILRELYPEIPVGTILDDVYVPMHVARMGRRVVFQPSAIARDKIFNERGKEFSRKVRTLTGNYQLMALSPWLITGKNPLLFRFVSHKILRLMVPLWLVLMVVASGMSMGLFYKILFWLQISFYLLAVVGQLRLVARRFRPIAIAHTFVMLNAAALMALYNFITRRKKIWV